MQIEKLLNKYCFPESRGLSQHYLQKFYLNEEDYSKKWKYLHEKFFKIEVEFPGWVFNLDWQIIPSKGGVLFVEKDLEIFKEFMKIAGDKSFSIIEHGEASIDPSDNSPTLQFQYPSNVKWNDLSIGDGISYELYSRVVRNYYVMGGSGMWARFVANDYKIPLDIFTIHKDYLASFKCIFQNYLPDFEEIVDWLPELYKDKITAQLNKQ